MQDEEDGLRSPSPGRQHFLTLQHSVGRFPHQWPTPWRDKPRASRWVDGQDQNEARMLAQNTSEPQQGTSTSAPTSRRRVNIGADRSCRCASQNAQSEQSTVPSTNNASVTGKLVKRATVHVEYAAENGVPDDRAVAARPLVPHQRLTHARKHTTGTTANCDRSKRRRTIVATSLETTSVSNAVNHAQHSCGDVLVSKTKRRQGRQRRWAGRAIEKMVRVGGQRVETYVSRRKARGEDRQLIAHWKDPAFYEQLSRESGLRLPDTWSSELPVMCEACFADSIATLCQYKKCIALQ